MTRHDQPGPRPAIEPLTAGPRWYRTRLRTFGPVLGVVPMAVLGAVSYIALRFWDGRASGLVGLLAGVSAAPGLLVAGAPFADEANYQNAVLGSIGLWLVLGFLASRRATRSPMAAWRDYWREMVWLTIAVVMGAVAALVAATAILGETIVV